MSIQTILDDAGKEFLKQTEITMRQNEQVVTGRTLRAIRYEVRPNGLTGYGPDYSGVLIDGRSFGGLPPIENIREWILAKGLTLDPWAVAKTIEREGTRLFRGSDPRFTKPTDTFSEPVNKTVEQLQRELTTFISLNLRSTIIEAFK